MRLIVATLQDDEAAGLLADLTRQGWGATQVASTGGALRSGATTLFIGVPRAQVSRVLRIIDEHCRRLDDSPFEPVAADDEAWYPPAMAAGEVGGAAISILKVVRFEQL